MMEGTKDISLPRKRFIIISSSVLFILAIEWLVGIFVDINILVLITYFSYIIIVFSKDTSFFVEYSWLIVMSSLNIIGVYACDSFKVYLREITTNSSYVCAVTPLALAYVTLFFTIRLFKYKYKKQYTQKSIDYSESTGKVINIIAFTGLGIVVFLFISTIRTPAFLLGVDRGFYMQNYMSGLEISLKRNIPLFIPAVILFMKKKKWFGYLFFIIVLLYYFWTGDKFGTYFQLGYFFLLFSSFSVNQKKIRKYAMLSMTFLLVLLIVVYIQRFLLYGERVEGFRDYVMERLAQQGQVWWSVYGKCKQQTLHIWELSDELSGVFPFFNSNNSYGQWKMILVAGDFSSYARYRVEYGQALTATTTATLYYYFKYVGVILIYIFNGFLYEKIIRTGIKMIKTKQVIVAMIAIKVLILFNNLISASDLTIISYKGFFYLILFILLSKNKIKLKKFYRHGVNR